MSPTADYAPSAAGPDELIPDPIVFREMNISAMSGWRWDRDPAMAELGWPARVRIRVGIIDRGKRLKPSKPICFAARSHNGIRSKELERDRRGSRSSPSTRATSA